VVKSKGGRTARGKCSITRAPKSRSESPILLHTLEIRERKKGRIRGWGGKKNVPSAKQSPQVGHLFSRQGGGGKVQLQEPFFGHSQALSI